MPDIDWLVREIDKELPEMARGVIRGHLDLTDPENRRFLDRPDGREQHQTEWHQWGIISHTRIFLRHFENDLEQYLEGWQICDSVERNLKLPVDGISRRELLRVAILLHDIGKFGARFRGRVRFHFTHHETLSGTIIRDELRLEQYGLTPAQIEYIARTAEDHFVLGVVRQHARNQESYGPAFAKSEDFEQVVREIRRDHVDDAIEIGVLFLCDSLAKADPQTGPERAVSQYEMNIAIARRYLELVVREESEC